MLSFTDLVSLFKMPLEQWKRIERLLFVFPEPFDKENSLKQFRISNITISSHNKLIYYQKVLLEQLIDVLDRYVTLYGKYGKSFTELLPTIEEPYYFLSLSIKDIECHPNFPFKNLYAKYDSYLLYLNSIKKDPETLVKNWEGNRSKVIDLIAYLNNFLFNNPYSEDTRPQLLNELVANLQQKLKQLEERLEENKQSTIYRQEDIEITPLSNNFRQDENDPLLFYLGDFGKIRMVSVHSSPTIILQMQIAKRGHLVTVREMLREINKKRNNVRKPLLVADDVRRKISQLNKRLANTTNAQVEIKESGQGSYRLWYNIKT